MNILHRQLSLGIACFALSFHGLAADVLTYHNNNARTGLNPDETTLTPQNVNANAFGLLRNLQVDGQVYAQPLYVSSEPVFSAGQSQGVHNLLIVATEHDSVYAFDADSMTQVWKTSLVGAGETPADDRGCEDLTPENGVTGTPVIDRGIGPFGQIYVIGMTKSTTTGAYFYRLHALNLSTGQEVAGSPVTIQATFPGTFPAGTTFNPAQERQRAALLLLNGVVYAAWAGFCDFAPYAGWIIAYNEKTLAQTAVLSLNPNGRPVAAGSSLPDGSGGPVWGSGGALAASPFGTIYCMTGNGPFDTALDANGFPQSRCFGDSFLKLSTTLSILDYFTPFNQAHMQQVDADLGSGGTLVVPQGAPGVGSAALVVGTGKDGNILILNQGNLGKFNPSGNNVYQEVAGGVPGGSFGSPAFFNGALYYCGGGINLSFNPKITRYTFTNARLNTTPTSFSPTGFGYPGTTPSVSASGTSNGIVWANERASDGSAVLHAYNALNLAQELYNSSQVQIGGAVKFAVPTVCNGKVFVGTANSVAVFGLLHPPVAKDFDGDGQADLVWENSVSGQRGIWILNNGVLSQVIMLPTIPTQWHIAGVGDFLGTGQADLVWENSVSGQRGIWILNNGVLSRTIMLPTVPTQWHIVGVGDFNGDGQADLVWEDAVSGQRGIWILKNGVLSQVIMLPTIPTQWHIAGAGDFNGDGNADLVWENTTTGQRAIWFLKNGVLLRQLYLPTVPVQWHIAGAGDFNGDGNADLVWENTTTGQRAIWFLKNGVPSSSINLPTVPLQWHIEDH